MSDWQNLSDQLRKMGVKFGFQEDISKRNKSWPIQSVLKCEETSTALGSILSVKKRYKLDYTQGNYNLHPAAKFLRLLQWADIPGNVPISLNNFIFLDAETTGLSGGTGTMIFLLGLSKYDDNDLILEQFFLRNPSEEEAFLHVISQFCKDMKVVITFNGKAFDIPILNTRHILQRVPSPFMDIYHIDLLTISRQLWKLRLEQCRLSNIEQHILQFHRDGAEVPGYLAPVFYKDYLRTGDARPLKGVFYHNQEDVVSLAALFSHIANILENPLDDKLPYSHDSYSLGRVFERLNETDIAHQLYQQSHVHQDDFNLRTRFLLQQASLFKRQNMYQNALSLWEEAAGLQSITAMEELAKYHEHKSKHLQIALQLTNRALEQLKDEKEMNLKVYTRFENRRTRLINKIKKTEFKG